MQAPPARHTAPCARPLRWPQAPWGNRQLVCSVNSSPCWGALASGLANVVYGYAALPAIGLATSVALSADRKLSGQRERRQHAQAGCALCIWNEGSGSWPALSTLLVGVSFSLLGLPEACHQGGSSSASSGLTSCRKPRHPPEDGAAASSRQHDMTSSGQRAIGSLGPVARIRYRPLGQGRRLVKRSGCDFAEMLVQCVVAGPCGPAGYPQGKGGSRFERDRLSRPHRQDAIPAR